MIAATGAVLHAPFIKRMVKYKWAPSLPALQEGLVPRRVVGDAKHAVVGTAKESRAGRRAAAAAATAAAAAVRLLKIEYNSCFVFSITNYE